MQEIQYLSHISLNNQSFKLMTNIE